MLQTTFFGMGGLDFGFGFNCFVIQFLASCFFMCFVIYFVCYAFDEFWGSVICVGMLASCQHGNIESIILI